MDKDTLRASFGKKKILELKNEETDNKNRQVLGNSPNTVKTKNGIKINARKYKAEPYFV